MSEKWMEVSKKLPPVYAPILMAFADSWNNVCGFYAGTDKRGKHVWYQHTADDHNQVIKTAPLFWMPSPPNKMREQYDAERNVTP